MRTDVTAEGFRLDRGFQVLLTSYPEAQAALDYPSLFLGKFIPGASIWFDREFHRVTDPRRDPMHAVATAFSPVAGLLDKLNLARLWYDLRQPAPSRLLERQQTTTLLDLKGRGFSDGFIRRFFHPFFAGVFLEDKLDTSSRLFEYTFRMFADGDAAIPAMGMGALTEQLAGRLRKTRIMLGSRVSVLSPLGATLADGSRIGARSVVVAVSEPEARAMLGEAAPGTPDPQPCGTTCVYFSSPKPPVEEPILILDGQGDGPVNHVAPVSNVCPRVAPPGQALISANLIGVPRESDEELLPQIIAQMTDWFGPQVQYWKHLRTYRIAYALPSSRPDRKEPWRLPSRLHERIYLAGDWTDSASQQGALESARRAAEAVMQDR